MGKKKSKQVEEVKAKEEILDIKEVALEVPETEPIKEEELTIDPIEINLNDLSEEIFPTKEKNEETETKVTEKTNEKKSIVSRLFGRLWNGQIFD